MYYQYFFLIVNIFWHSAQGTHRVSLNTNTNRNSSCNVQLSKKPWGQSSWGEYKAYDKNKKIEPKLITRNRPGNTTNTRWEYSLPANSTIIGKCHDTYINTDGTNTISTTCKLGQWEPSLATFCHSSHQVQQASAVASCTDSKTCIRTCDTPKFDDIHFWSIYDENGKDLGILLSKAPNKAKLEITCDEYHVTTTGTNGSFTSTCFEHSSGSGWKPEINLPKCSRICDAVPTSMNVLFESCSMFGTKVSCNGTLAAGASAIAVCKDKNFTEGGNGRSEAYCAEDGTWNNLPYCIAGDCGRVKSNKPRLGTFEVGGKKAIFGRYAWHVAIYDITKKPPLLICGGTIVTSRMVLSAAHCFFDENSGKQLQKDNYEILVSKQTRDYIKKDNYRTEKYKLKEIIFSPKEYNPTLSGNYGSDIVILVPEKNITFYEGYVFPVCLVWNDRPHGYNIKTSGEVYGWGYNEHGVLSENLTYVDLPYINYNDCIRKVKTKHVTQDKFCAGNDMGTGLRQGDSGGGYMEFWNGKYYLRGIVSDRDGGDDTTSINSFTEVSYYIGWIFQIGNRLHSQIAVDSLDDSKYKYDSSTNTYNTYDSSDDDANDNVPIRPTYIEVERRIHDSDPMIFRKK